jgi:short-subunit dehydrogenase
MTKEKRPYRQHSPEFKHMKKAIVIGASSGIGRELAKKLSQDGYTVGVMARRKHLLEELRKEIQSEIFIQEIDLAHTESAMDILSTFINQMGGIDIIVISAGAGEINNDLNWQVENETIKTNVIGFTALVNVAIHHFIERGLGHLVCVSSIAALRGGRESPAYNASKAFEANYMEGLRKKIRKLQLPIIVTDVKPGFVKTAMAKGEDIFWAAPAEKAARQIHVAIKKKTPNVYVTRRWRLIAWILKAMPDYIYEKL